MRLNEHEVIVLMLTAVLLFNIIILVSLFKTYDAIMNRLQRRKRP